MAARATPAAARAPAMLWLEPREGGRIVESNEAAVRLFGLQADTLRGRALASFAGAQPDGVAAPTLGLAARLALVEQGESLSFDWSFQDGRGRQVHCEADLQPEGEQRPAARLRLQLAEVDLNERAEALRQGQAELLELVARGAPLQDTLLRLTQLIESQSVGLYCSLLLLGEDGVHIAGGVGPRLPADYMAALNGYAIGPNVGSCGTAMTLRRMVIVSDIDTDPLWAPYKFLVVPHGLRACWSTPIYLGAEQVLGSFAMYYKEVRSPQPVEMRLMEVARHLAGIAIERDRRERALKRYEQELEALVAERTRELAQAKEAAEQNLQALRLAQDELVRNKKLAALGALVSGVAHELNTPIGNGLLAASTLADDSRGFALEIAQTQLRKSDLLQYLGRTQENAQLLMRNLNRAAELVEKFKQVASGSAGARRQRFRLADAVAEALAWVGSQAPPTLALELQQQIPPQLELEGHPLVLQQLLKQLLENAVQHAFPGRSEGRICVEAEDLGEQGLRLQVGDDGVGVAPEHRERVFEPFFSTRFGSGGSGLGLSLVNSLVRDVLGGRITLLDDGAAGCRIEIRLPRQAPGSPSPDETR